MTGHDVCYCPICGEWYCSKCGAEIPINETPVCNDGICFPTRPCPSCEE